jgi:hypothetical protein
VSHISACSKPKLQSVSASPSAFIRRAPEHSYFFLRWRIPKNGSKKLCARLSRWWCARRVNAPWQSANKEGPIHYHCRELLSLGAHKGGRHRLTPDAESQSEGLCKDVHRHSLSAALVICCCPLSMLDVTQKVSTALESLCTAHIARAQVQGAPQCFCFCQVDHDLLVNAPNYKVTPFTQKKYLNCFIGATGSYWCTWTIFFQFQCALSY